MMSKTGLSGSHSDLHVHFDEACLKEECDDTVTYMESKDGIIVNLGFLQIKNKYIIELKLPANLFKHFTDSPVLVPDNSSVPNIHCKIVKFSGIKCEENNSFEMKIKFFAYKDNFIREELKILNLKNSKEFVKLILYARVLGIGMGKPLLRKGIHLYSLDKEHYLLDDSDSERFGDST